MITDRKYSARFIGLSTDAPPENPQNGSELFCIDTQSTIYFVEGNGWHDPNVKSPVSLALTDIATQTEWEDFDDTGIVATVTYSDDTTAEVEAEITAELIDHVWVVTGVYTENGIRVTDTENATTTELDLSAIEVKTPPEKTEYTVGEAIDMTGLVLLATYNSGDTEDVSEGYEFTPEEAAEDTESVTISYKFRETTKTTTQAVTVAPAE